MSRAPANRQVDALLVEKAHFGGLPLEFDGGGEGGRRPKRPRFLGTDVKRGLRFQQTQHLFELKNTDGVFVHHQSAYAPPEARTSVRTSYGAHVCSKPLMHAREVQA